MERKPPPPIVQSFLICREIFQDRLTGEDLLLGPCTGITLGGFPAAVRVGLYIRLTGAHGVYRLSVQLRDEAGELIGEWTGGEPVIQNDPLMTRPICWRNLTLQIPRPGRFDVILLANGEDLAHHAFQAAINANS